MLAGLRRLVGADTGFSAEVPEQGARVSQPVVGVVIDGVHERRLLAVYRALMEKAALRYARHAMGAEDYCEQTVLANRQQMAPDRILGQRPDLDPWRTLDCEHFILSSRRVPGVNCVHLITLTRPQRREPFGDVDRRVVALFHHELGRLWRGVGPAVDTVLGPGLRQTLELLLDGASEKQIATRLQLSAHTVHDRVKRLYRRFDVHSRAQLSARLSRASPARAPCLSTGLLDDAAGQRAPRGGPRKIGRASDAPAMSRTVAACRTSRGPGAGGTDSQGVLHRDRPFGGRRVIGQCTDGSGCDPRAAPKDALPAWAAALRCKH